MLPICLYAGDSIKVTKKQTITAKTFFFYTPVTFFWDLIVNELKERFFDLERALFLCSCESLENELNSRLHWCQPVAFPW